MACGCADDGACADALRAPAPEESDWRYVPRKRSPKIESAVKSGGEDGGEDGGKGGGEDLRSVFYSGDAATPATPATSATPATAAAPPRFSILRGN